MTGKNPDRKQVGVHIDIELWRKFRARALEQGIGAGILLEELIARFLREQQKQQATQRAFKEQKVQEKQGS